MKQGWTLITLSLMLAGCRNEKSSDPFQQFQGEVKCERPRTALRFHEPRGRDSLMVAGIDKFISGRPVVLDSLASGCQFSARESGAGWSLMGAFDDGSGDLHLVYFNRYRRERIMAGRKMHLCFDRNRELQGIYVYEVPLE